MGDGNDLGTARIIRIAPFPFKVIVKKDRLLNKLAAAFKNSPVAFAIDLPDGESRVFGNGEVGFRLKVSDERACWAFASLDEGRIADAYINGYFNFEGDIVKALDMRAQLTDNHAFHGLWRFIQPLLFGQVYTNARAIPFHYDMSHEFFLSFMGEDRCYSHAIFEDANEPLETAMRRKFDYCIEACELGPGSRVLEVGPGWGAFTAHAAARGINVTGITISKASQNFLNDLKKRLGLEWTVLFGDFLAHQTDEPYDAVVTMGIMEHLPDYPRVVKQFDRLTRPGGKVYVDACASRRKFDLCSFMYRRVYRGNTSCLVLHDFLEAAARFRFRLGDVFNDTDSYRLTCQRWAEKLESVRDEVVAKFGDNAYRRFHLYLWGAVHTFGVDGTQAHRLVLHKPA